MLVASLGIVFSTMVGPLDERTVRISKPGSGPPEVVRQTVAAGPAGGVIVVPNNAVGGGGGVTVVGAEARAAEEAAIAAAAASGPEPIVTEQVLRAFGYDRSRFGYTVLHGQWGGWGRGGGWWRHHREPEARVDRRVEGTLRDAAPIESRWPQTNPPGR